MPHDSRFFLPSPELRLDMDALNASNVTKFSLSLLLTGTPEDLQQAKQFFNKLIYKQYLDGAHVMQVMQTMAPYKRLCAEYKHLALSAHIDGQIERLYPQPPVATPSPLAMEPINHAP